MRNDLSQLTLLIPLYHSSRFSDIIEANIASHLACGATVLVSDRHLLDGYSQQLSERFTGEARLKIYSASDKLNWVENINFLMTQIKTAFFRILPHDDSTTSIASTALLKSLIQHPKSIVATGIIRAIDLTDQRLENKDEMASKPAYVERQWNLKHALDFYYRGFYPGSFKGVIRTESIHKHQLYIQSTATLINSERLWLFALHLLGPFCYVNIDSLYKRYYEESTHRQWQRSKQQELYNTEVMIHYCRRLIKNTEMRITAEKHIRQNGFLRYQQQNSLANQPAPYYHDYSSELST